MSDTTPGSWQPDPYGRFAQRYWDGTEWTATVADAAGNQSTDPPVPSATPAAAATASTFPATTAAPGTSSALPVPALIVAGVGALLLLLSLFVLNWYDFGSEFKDQVKNADSSELSAFESQTGLSVSEVTDGLKFSEIKTVKDKSGEDASTAAEQYLNWGYLAAIAAAAFVIAALFVPNLRWPALVVALLFAAWHGYVVNDLGDSQVDTQIGAWVGVAGLVVSAVALLLPRPAATA